MIIHCFPLGACDLYTWGGGDRGILGHKDEDAEMLPRVVESLLGRDIVMLACGVYHTMALSGEKDSWVIKGQPIAAKANCV